LTLQRRVEALEALAGDPEPAELSTDELGALHFRLHKDAEKRGFIVRGPWDFYTVSATVTDPEILDFCERDVEFQNEVQSGIYERFPQRWLDMGRGAIPYPVSIEAGVDPSELFTLKDVQSDQFDQVTGARLR